MTELYALWPGSRSTHRRARAVLLLTWGGLVLLPIAGVGSILPGLSSLMVNVLVAVAAAAHVAVWVWLAGGRAREHFLVRQAFSASASYLADDPQDPGRAEHLARTGLEHAVDSARRMDTRYAKMVGWVPPLT